MIHINRNTAKTDIKATDIPTVDLFKKYNVYYPDQPSVKWQNVINGQFFKINSLTQKTSPKICIIGRGASAIGILCELASIKERDSNFQPDITNIYYDTETTEASSTDNSLNPTQKWGRIFSVKSENNYQEIGCMRFPLIAIVTWNYISKAYPDSGSTPLVLFPNPGRVPTQFLFRDMNVIFEKDNNGQVTPIPEMNSDDNITNLSVMEKVKNGVISLLINYEIKDYTGLQDRPVNAQYFIDLLISDTETDAPINSLSPENVAQVWAEWDMLTKEFDVPLIDKVIEAVDDLINNGTIESTEYRDKNYYIELFGRYGFGTGGFRPLNNISFVEIVRLLIWDYSNEYLFPNNPGDGSVSNSEFAQRLYDQCTTALGTVTKINEKALFVGQVKRASENKIIVLSSNSDDGSTIRSTEFDYVFIAVSHHAAQKLVEPFTGLKAGEFIPAGQDLNFHPTIESTGGVLNYRLPEDMYHAVDPVQGGEGNIYNALKNLHMMRSTKYFTNVSTMHFENHSPTQSGGGNAKQVKMVISDTDLAATYCLDGLGGTKSILVSYTWGDEASNESSRLRGLTKTAGTNNNNKLLERHIEAANRFTKTTDPAHLINNVEKPFWVREMLKEARTNANMSGYMYDWTADRDARGGFKLDNAGESPLANALYFHYKTHTRTMNTQRVFLAGDSISHLGGWLEGAFISAINAVAGFTRSAYSSDVLTAEGMKLFDYPALTKRGSTL